MQDFSTRSRRETYKPLYKIWQYSQDLAAHKASIRMSAKQHLFHKISEGLVEDLCAQHTMSVRPSGWSLISSASLQDAKKTLHTDLQDFRKILRSLWRIWNCVQGRPECSWDLWQDLSTTPCYTYLAAPAHSRTFLRAAPVTTPESDHKYGAPSSTSKTSGPPHMLPVIYCYLR